MQLHVANTTRQRHEFYYRLPESRSWSHQYIEIGGQIRVSGELDPVTVETITAHHARYGMVRVDEISRTSGKIPLVYSTSGPIPAATIERVINQNDRVLAEQGRRMREEAGMAAAASSEAMLHDRRPAGEQFRNTEFTLVEDRRDPRDQTPEVAEGVRVAPDPGEASKHVQKRRSR